MYDWRRPRGNRVDIWFFTWHACLFIYMWSITMYFVAQCAYQNMPRSLYFVVSQNQDHLGNPLKCYKLHRRSLRCNQGTDEALGKNVLCWNGGRANHELSNFYRLLPRWCNGIRDCSSWQKKRFRVRSEEGPALANWSIFDLRSFF